MTWKPDDAGQREWLLSAQAAAAVRPATERIKAAAEATAPVGDPASDPHSGMYRDSFRSDVSVDKVAHGPDRQVGHVYNDAPHAAAVEYGYAGRSKEAGRSAHHTLTRAIDAARE